MIIEIAYGRIHVRAEELVWVATPAYVRSYSPRAYEEFIRLRIDEEVKNLLYSLAWDEMV